jgi:hypothetical protein
MKYMLLTYLDEKKWLAMSEEEQRRAMAECEPHVKSLTGTGKLLTTDGPFAETREQLGGYTLIEADDLDDALAIAAGFLGNTEWVTIEVRPVVEFDRVGTRVSPR